MKNSTKECLDRYVNEHIEPGGFLLALLSNDLRDACGRADEENARDLWEIVAYCWNNIPASCWGSREKVNAWLAKRDLSPVQEAPNMREEKEQP